MKQVDRLFVLLCSTFVTIFQLKKKLNISYFFLLMKQISVQANALLSISEL